MLNQKKLCFLLIFIGVSMLGNDMKEITASFASSLMQERSPFSHKGDYGRLLLIGGNCPYGGAIIMAALASVHSGAGLVTVATHKDNISALHSHLPEAMAFDMANQDLLERQIRQADTILLGPGLAEDQLAKTVFDSVLRQISCQQVLILDGSALPLLAKCEGKIPNCHLILTPHQREWEVLSGVAVADQSLSTYQKALKKFPAQTILVAKKYQTELFQDQEVRKIKVGGPYQATGGMGDTLAGMIAGLSQQFRDASLFDRVSLAVYLHSAIAEQLSQEHYVVLPTMISQEISRWMKQLSQEKK